MSKFVKVKGVKLKAENLKKEEVEDALVGKAEKHYHENHLNGIEPTNTFETMIWFKIKEE